MRHVFFALFADATEADAAVHEIGDFDAGKERCHVERHTGGLDYENLALGETRGQTRLVQGALLGGVLTGVSSPDTKLERMEALMRSGAVVLAVDAEGQWESKQAEQIVRRHGALVQHHALI